MSICENSYYYFIGALNDQQCNAIIERGLSDMTLTEQKSGKQATDATTFDFRQKGGETSNAGNIAQNHLTAQGRRKKGIKEEDVYVRDTKVGWLADKWIYDLIHPYIQEANQKANWNYQWDFSETCQFTVYNPQFALTIYNWLCPESPVYYLQFTIPSYFVQESQFTVYNSQCTLYSLQFTLYTLQFTFYSLQFTI